MPFFMRPVIAFSDWLRHRLERKKLSPTKALGNYGEDVAHRYLENQGYIVMERNWRSRSGLIEIDLIAWQREPERFVFVEVKTRATAEYGDPDRNVDEGKERAYRAAAEQYARSREMATEMIRFDVVTVVTSPKLTVRHVTDAFGWR
jgi:putative endonuclease